MLCHVTRPDSVVMEVEVDAKANGEDCLNKVSCGGIYTFCYCDIKQCLRSCRAAVLLVVLKL